MNEKLEKFFKAFDADIKESKSRVTIGEDSEQMHVINQALIKNPGWVGYYNSRHSVLQKILLEENHKLEIMEANYFVTFKEAYDGSRAPSDNLVNAKISNCVDVQARRYVCSRLGYYDKRFKSIVQSLTKQLDALTVLSNNLRKEL